MCNEVISVIIPCYNVENYIQDAIQSVLEQTYKYFEIILVDDGSTDRTSALCDQYADEYDFIQAIHKENGGQSSARNIGLKYAKGEYIYFLDSDDKIKKNLFQDAMEVFKKQDIDVVFFDGIVIDEAGAEISSNKQYKRENLSESVQDGHWWYKELMNKNVFLACVPFHIYKRRLLQKHHLSFYEGIIHEDELFLFKVYLNAETMKWLPNTYYERRIREGSTMTMSQALYRFDSLNTIWGQILTEYQRGEYRKSGTQMFEMFSKRIYDLIIYRYSQLNDEERNGRRSDCKSIIDNYWKTVLRQGRFTEAWRAIKHYYYIYRLG